MIDVEEHFYDDDPSRGHPDVRTRLRDAFYFFLGNGLIQAAVQIAPSGEGTPLGLLIMNPEQLRQKRDALTLDVDTGLENTLIHLQCEGREGETEPVQFLSAWIEEEGVPAVRVEWSGGGFHVTEFFFCPDRSNPELMRRVQIKNLSEMPKKLTLHTGVPGKMVEKEIVLAGGEEQEVCLSYLLSPDRSTVALDYVPETGHRDDAVEYWRERTRIFFESTLLDRHFNSSSYQLPAALSEGGVVDASIWQYNREWVRDHSFIGIGLLLSGHHKEAGILFERLLREFVSDEGDTIDSSEIRDLDEVELDQNGTLLWALKSYVLWTGDHDLISKYWDKIEKVAEFPLKEDFLHRASGMLANRRDYWERHALHGIETGIELMYQVFPSIGLSAAAVLARLQSMDEKAARWDKLAGDLKAAILDHPEFAMIDGRGFVKRRGLDGSIQETIIPETGSRLPAGIPLTLPGEHFLNPDTSAAIPVALSFVPPESEVAIATLRNLEMLWNQEWDEGGYPRYHISSEADYPGSWPFPSLFIARACMETGDLDNVWRILKWLDSIPGSLSGAWFENYGDRISPPYPQVGIPPWTWAEVVMLAVHHILGIQPEEEHIRIRPRLLPGLQNVVGNLQIRDHRVELILKREPGIPAPRFRTDAGILGSSESGILIAYPEGDVTIEGTVP